MSEIGDKCTTNLRIVQAFCKKKDAWHQTLEATGQGHKKSAHGLRTNANSKLLK